MERDERIAKIRSEIQAITKTQRAPEGALNQLVRVRTVAGYKRYIQLCTTNKIIAKVDWEQKTIRAWGDSIYWPEFEQMAKEWKFKLIKTGRGFESPRRAYDNHGPLGPAGYTATSTWERT